MITNHRDVKHPYGKTPEAPSSLLAGVLEQKTGLLPAHVKPCALQLILKRAGGCPGVFAGMT